MSWTKEYFSELKAETTTAPMILDNEFHRIKILHHGEQLFFFDKKKDKAVIVEIQIRNGMIFQDSISQWDDGAKISTDEKTTILSQISNYFKEIQQVEAAVI